MSKELWERHKVSAGLDFRRSFQIQQENYSETPFALNLSDHRQTTVISPYLTSEWALRTNLHFHAGARLDYYDQNTHSANPRLGLVWQPVSATVLKALYGTAFRAPNAYELYYTDGYVTQKPAANLRPETVDTYELVWEQALGRRWQFSASGYFYQINNAIQQDPDPADGLLAYHNAGRNTGRGLETELTYRPSRASAAASATPFRQPKTAPRACC